MREISKVILYHMIHESNKLLLLQLHFLKYFRFGMKREGLSIPFLLMRRRLIFKFLLSVNDEIILNVTQIFYKCLLCHILSIKSKKGTKSYRNQRIINSMRFSKLVKINFLNVEKSLSVYSTNVSYPRSQLISMTTIFLNVNCDVCSSYSELLLF